MSVSSDDILNQNEQFLRFEIYSKQQFQLKPKSSWVPDSKVSSCQFCEKSFISFFRRKHHCRMCGKIFCHNCSKFFLPSEEFCQVEEKEKLLRFCQNCYEKIIQSKQKLKQKFFVSDIEQRFNKQFKNIVTQKINQMIGITAKQYKINSNWLGAIKALVLEAFFVNNDDTDMQLYSNTLKKQKNGFQSMNINDLIKIKTIHSTEKTQIKIIKGYVFKKNIPNRKMQLSFEEPYILVISPNLDLEDADGFYSLENDQNSIKKVNELFKNILKLNPDIIFVEKNINSKLYEMLVSEKLTKKKITIITKIKNNDIRQISQVVGAQIIKKPEIIGTEDGRQLLGICGKFRFKGINNINKNGIEEQSQWIFIKRCNPGNGLTFLVKHSKLDELKNLKRAMKQIILYSYHFYLESKVIKTELLTNVVQYEDQQALTVTKTKSSISDNLAQQKKAKSNFSDQKAQQIQKKKSKSIYYDHLNQSQQIVYHLPNDENDYDSSDDDINQDLLANAETNFPKKLPPKKLSKSSNNDLKEVETTEIKVQATNKRNSLSVVKVSQFEFQEEIINESIPKQYKRQTLYQKAPPSNKSDQNLKKETIFQKFNNMFQQNKKKEKISHKSVSISNSQGVDNSIQKLPRFLSNSEENELIYSRFLIDLLQAEEYISKTSICLLKIKNAEADSKDIPDLISNDIKNQEYIEKLKNLKKICKQQLKNIEFYNDKIWYSIKNKKQKKGSFKSISDNDTTLGRFFLKMERNFEKICRVDKRCNYQHNYYYM